MTIKEFTKLANINNNLIALYSRDINNPHYSNRIYDGMEWALLESSLANLPFKKLLGLVSENIYESDRINIEVDIPGLTKDNIENTEWGRYIPTEEEIHRNHHVETSSGGDNTDYTIYSECIIDKNHLPITVIN